MASPYFIRVWVEIICKWLFGGGKAVTLLAEGVG